MKDSEFVDYMSVFFNPDNQPSENLNTIFEPSGALIDEVQTAYELEFKFNFVFEQVTKITNIGLNIEAPGSISVVISAKDGSDTLVTQVY